MTSRATGISEPFRSICVVALDAYELLASAARVQFVGGESVQHVLLAKAWRDLGLDVTLLVHDQGQPRDSRIDGLRVLATCGRNEGLPVVRFIHPRMTSLMAGLRRADADVVYQSPAGVNTGWVARYCRSAGKPFIFRIASDANCKPGEQLIDLWRDRKLFEYGMRRATLIAAQTDYQRTLLRDNYGLPSEIVNMVAEPGVPSPLAAKDIDVLWVSNFRSVKRPEALLTVARACPELRFSMVGGKLPGAERYFDQIVAEAKTLPNVTVHGAVPYGEVGALFDRAKVFLNTSVVEGFPNTYLQAWMRGLPVVATFDPDSLIRRRGLGHSDPDVAALVAPLKALLADPARLADVGQAAYAFALQEYSPRAVAQRYLELLAGAN